MCYNVISLTVFCVLCVFNQANKLQSLRCGGGLIKTLPDAGGKTGGERRGGERAEEKLRRMG